MKPEFFTVDLAKPLVVAIICGAAVVAVVWSSLSFIVYRELVFLARIRCPSCGIAFGMPAAKQAKKTYSEQCAADWKRAEAMVGGTLLIDFDGRWPVECPACRNRVSYDTQDRAIVPPA